MALHEMDPDWINPENDPLVRRLRDLEWAKVSPELRDRCWERISNRMADVPLSQPVSQPFVPVREIGERYDFSRRQVPCRDAVAQAWSRRPHLRAVGTRSALALS